MLIKFDDKDNFLELKSSAPIKIRLIEV